MNNEIAKRYMLCSNCSDRILNERCDDKYKEYWKYIGATEQKAIENNKARKAFNAACGWLFTYSWYNAVVEEFIKNIEE